ncbi:MAG: alpha/beta hydrolase [Acidobacteriota bacterium]
MRRRLPIALAAGGAAAWVGASWIVARSLARRLISPHGLTPCQASREGLLSGLTAAGARVNDYRFPGSTRQHDELCAILATPGEGASPRTIVFLHGKGGSAAEWAPDAVRAVGLGYNALLPDLRGHRPSGGEFITYGLLEREDLSAAIAAAQARFGLDASRLAVHSCSAGSSTALVWAADEPRVRGIWLESPFADAREMARHYLGILTGLPRWVLGLTTTFAVRRALRSLRDDLGVTPEEILASDPLRSAARVRVPVEVVFGDEDFLVPPRFTQRLIDALPPGTTIWNPQGAGHCHHDNEAQKVNEREYLERWVAFFERVLG